MNKITQPWIDENFYNDEYRSPNGKNTLDNFEDYALNATRTINMATNGAVVILGGFIKLPNFTVHNLKLAVASLIDHWSETNEYTQIKNSYEVTIGQNTSQVIGSDTTNIFDRLPQTSKDHIIFSSIHRILENNNVTLDISPIEYINIDEESQLNVNSAEFPKYDIPQSDANIAGWGYTKEYFYNLIGAVNPDGDGDFSLSASDIVFVESGEDGSNQNTTVQNVITSNINDINVSKEDIKNLENSIKDNNDFTNNQGTVNENLDKSIKDNTDDIKLIQNSLYNNYHHLETNHVRRSFYFHLLLRHTSLCHWQTGWSFHLH